MTTITSEDVTAQLATISASELRRAFPAHRQLANTRLVYTPDGIGHVRDVDTSGSVLVCGRACWPATPLPQERWHFTTVHGLTMLPRLGCAACAEHLTELREAASDEREALRVTIAHSRAVEGTLTDLQNAACS
jgi:hypothetical protein